VCASENLYHAARWNHISWVDDYKIKIG